MKFFSTAVSALSAILFFSACAKPGKEPAVGSAGEARQISEALNTIGLAFTPSELDSMASVVMDEKENLAAIRAYPLPNQVAPALLFDPRPMGFALRESSQIPNFWEVPQGIDMPADRNELAFFSILELASLIKHKKTTSAELTAFFLERLAKHGDTLACVVTITADRAMAQAQKADRMLAEGNYKGVLHGIPFGVKDLFSAKGHKTTWGAMPYKDQMIDEDAAVVQRLEEAGAVLVAKLTLGALAFGDVWFGGVTKNPWDLGQGSSGSSAGSASATVAGLVPFAIGTETWGSIVSPSARCGATGLRPTFGRVSRQGAMALSWSMDKIGPICRSATDCAIVFDFIRGTDGKDLSVVDASFNFTSHNNIKTMKVGYLEALFKAEYPNKSSDEETLAVLRGMGIDLQPVSLPDDIPVQALQLILMAEGAAAFDELTLSDKDDLLVRQVKSAWPNIFRASRLIPAVEYVNANRLRTLLMEKTHARFKDFDVVVSPSFGGNQLLITNLTGQPCVVVPNGFNDKGRPVSVSFLGNLYDEASPLRLAAAYQAATGFHKERPGMFLK